MMHKLRVGVVAALTSVAALPAAAQYPEQPVELIVPWSPGGGSDTLMRIVSNNVEEYLGQPMPIINMPGVSGTQGLETAAEREANGYTVAQVHEGLLVSNATGLTELDWQQAFDPIALMVSSPQYVVVNADRDYETFQQFIDYAKQNPGDIRMGVTLGGVPHLHAAMIEDAYDVEFSYVGYEGTGERIRALVGGDLDAAIGDIASAGQFVENGDLRFLATGAAERVEDTPDVPTFQELGADLALAVNRGIVMPKGAPEEAQDTLEAALSELANDEEFIQQVENAGAQVSFRGQEEYTQYLTDLTETIERLSSRLNK